MTPTANLLHEELTHSIIGAFYMVHRTLGYGFSEYVYSAVLERELGRRGHRAVREVRIPVYYLGDLVCYQCVDCWSTTWSSSKTRLGKGRKPLFFRVVNSLGRNESSA